MANILAIDQGTSSTKALVVAEAGEVLGEGSASVNPEAKTGGAVEQERQELLDSIVAAGRAAVAAPGVAGEAVGIANQGETVLRWDRESGKPFGPALSWQDRRAAPIARELEGYADRLTEITGLPLDPYFAAPKMTWLRRETGDEGVITMIDAWLNLQLAGAFVTDAATASRTLLLDLESTTWSDEACALFEIDPATQPEIVDCAASVGETAVFGDPLPVTGLVVDQQGAPFWAPDARGGWLGLSLATSRDDLVRAVIWGMAAQVASLARAMGDDMGRPLERLRVDGGLTRSKALMQAQADLLQAPVERYPSADATALGAGALARLGRGVASTPQEAVGDWTPDEVFEPRMTAAESQERLARWEAGAAALADLSRNGN